MYEIFIVSRVAAINTNHTLAHGSCERSILLFKVRRASKWDRGSDITVSRTVNHCLLPLSLYCLSPRTVSGTRFRYAIVFVPPALLFWFLIRRHRFFFNFFFPNIKLYFGTMGVKHNWTNWVGLLRGDVIDLGSNNELNRILPLVQLKLGSLNV